MSATPIINLFVWNNPAKPTATNIPPGAGSPAFIRFGKGAKTEIYYYQKTEKGASLNILNLDKDLLNEIKDKFDNSTMLLSKLPDAVIDEITRVTGSDPSATATASAPEQQSTQADSDAEDRSALDSVDLVDSTAPADEEPSAVDSARAAAAATLARERRIRTDQAQPQPTRSNDPQKASQQRNQQQSQALQQHHAALMAARQQQVGVAGQEQRATQQPQQPPIPRRDSSDQSTALTTQSSALASKDKVPFSLIQELIKNARKTYNDSHSDKIPNWALIPDQSDKKVTITGEDGIHIGTVEREKDLTVYKFSKLDAQTAYVGLLSAGMPVTLSSNNMDDIRLFFEAEKDINKTRKPGSEIKMELSPESEKTILENYKSIQEFKDSLSPPQPTHVTKANPSSG